MPGQYSSHCRSRPCALLPAAPTTARLFLCARCQAQVLVCSHCDRGQIYCAQGCAQTARRDAQRAAGRRYQASRRGRVNHAARAGRYRARQNNVTHQGSPPHGGVAGGGHLGHDGPKPTAFAIACNGVALSFKQVAA